MKNSRGRKDGRERERSRKGKREKAGEGGQGRGVEREKSGRARREGGERVEVLPLIVPYKHVLFLKICYFTNACFFTMKLKTKRLL